MRPNVNRTVKRWAKKFVMVKRTVITVNFEPQEVLQKRIVKATIQPAQKKRLNKDLVDWSLTYMQLHSSERVFIGEFFKFGKQVFKIVDEGNFDLYGYTDAVGEEVKNCEMDDGHFDVESVLSC